MPNSLDHPALLGFGSLLLVAVALSAGTLAGGAGPAAAEAAHAAELPPPPPAGAIRVATFNIFELSCAKIDELDAQGKYSNPQLKNAAEVLKRVRPHILLVNEIDFHPMQNCARLFYERYLRGNEAAAGGKSGLKGLDYPYLTYLPVNTGVLSGLDLNNDGSTTGPEDAWGFGTYPGQYGMALFSSYKIDDAAVRTFQNLKWKEMPGHRMPDGQDGRPAYYPAKNAEQLRLSSKSHWDVPIEVRGKKLHLLASHPTPPVFDGPEDRNGRRNWDEIRLWADYLTGCDAAMWLVDDQGKRGGLAQDAAFVLLGDLNADALQGDKLAGESKNAIGLLLEHPRVQPLLPLSPGDRPPRVPAAGKPPYPPYPGEARSRTSDYGRLDYVLPSRNLEVVGSGVYFPAEDDPRRALVLGEHRASDHNLVYVDLRFPKSP